MIKDFNLLEVGKVYDVRCDIWHANLIYCGSVQKGKRIYYRFTFGKTVEDWKTNFNIFATKSNLKVKEIA